MTQELYNQFKDEMAQVVETLVDLSVEFLKSEGNFLPHGSVVAKDGELRLVGAMPDSDKVEFTSQDILPMLHEGLRASVADGDVSAVAVAENVQVSPDGGAMINAIKVLYENDAGLCVAFYTPFRKKLLGGYRIDAAFAAGAEPEVNPNWSATRH